MYENIMSVLTRVADILTKKGLESSSQFTKPEM